MLLSVVYAFHLLKALNFCSPLVKHQFELIEIGFLTLDLLPHPEELGFWDLSEFFARVDGSQYR